MVPGIQTVDPLPEINPKSIEVGSNIAGVWIASVQRAVPDEFGPQKGLELGWRYPDDVIHAF
jgi:hypothetical protein